ncbi:hypothetical protein LCGC14_0560370 [marine sediment metagenome]|uniref:Uncharacterized protein n=1 Tax=marine sediment metagenome TaxID=412755 RepID=A0A0F9RSF1_9ZZZZ
MTKINNITFSLSVELKNVIREEGDYGEDKFNYRFDLYINNKRNQFIRIMDANSKDELKKKIIKKIQS